MLPGQSHNICLALRKLQKLHLLKSSFKGLCLALLILFFYFFYVFFFMCHKQESYLPGSKIKEFKILQKHNHFTASPLKLCCTMKDDKFNTSVTLYSHIFLLFHLFFFSFFFLFKLTISQQKLKQHLVNFLIFKFATFQTIMSIMLQFAL